MNSIVEVVEVPELVTPEIPVVETEYDMFEKNRQTLISKLKSGDLKQVHGSWSGSQGEVCILQAAFDNVQDQ
jgi:hypothetical protein